MIFATTPLPTPVKAESSENIEFEDNSKARGLYTDGARAFIWGDRTMADREAAAHKSKQHTRSTTNFSYSNMASNNILFSAWCEKAASMLYNWDSDTPKQLIGISERYLLALKKSPSHRLFISNLLNVYRFNSSMSTQDVDKIARALDRYKKSNITKTEVVAFMRELRAIGYSPSAIGNVSVE